VPKIKTSAMALDKHLLLPINLGKVIRSFISPAIWSPSFYCEKDDSQVENIKNSCQSVFHHGNKFTPRSDHPKLREIENKINK